ncbi:hypothetical protein P2318_17195 [Myxococcaceae bacterium GXIMD 01537]
MPYTHRTLMPLLLALGLTHCAPPLSEQVEDAQARAEEEVEAQWNPPCPSAYLVEDSAEGPASSSPRNLLDADGRLFYSADDGVHGREPWRSEGTRATTRLIKDIVPGAAGSSPSEYVEVHGRAYFSVRNELWKSDGTGGGTSRVATFPENSRPSVLLDFHGKLLFAVDTPEFGRELWISDGTTRGTKLWLDVNPGPATGFLGDIVELEDDIVFDSLLGEGASSRRALLRVDSRRRVTELYGTPGDTDIGIFRVTVVGDSVFFLVDFTDGEPSLVVSDGTAGGARFLHDFFDSNTPRDFTDFKGQLYFSADEPGTTGTELWTSDGTPAGTVLVKDIRPGVEGSGPDGLTVVGERLYFSADDGEHGRELWRSDGTESGTQLAADIRAGPEGSAPLSLVRVNKRLYFSADEGVHGREPWKFDGGRARLVADIARGPASSISTAFPPLDFVRSGDLLYAIADDGIHGEELWALPLSSDACPRGVR